MNNIAISYSPVDKNTQSFSQSKTIKQPIAPPIERDIEKIYRSQGYLGKFFDKIHGLFNIGLSKKKLEGKEQDKEVLSRYYDQKKNETEAAIDLMTGLGAAGSFRFAKKFQTYSHLYMKNPKFEVISSVIGVGLSAISGMFLKPILKSINEKGIPKKERRFEKTRLKDFGTGLIDGLGAPLMYVHKLGIFAAAGINSLTRYAFNKKQDKENALSNHLKDGWLIKAPLAGIAAFSAFKFHKRINVLEKAIANSKENVKDIARFKENIPFMDIVEIVKNNVKDKETQNNLIDCARKGFFSKTYLMTTNFFKKFIKKDIIPPYLQAAEFAPKSLKRLLFMNKELIKTSELENMMKEIEKYNIFYPKLLQTLPGNPSKLLKSFGLSADKLLNFQQESAKKGFFVRKITQFRNNRTKYLYDNIQKIIDDFINNYKSNCPPSRTIAEAQKSISDSYGKKYSIIGEKPLGVGTVAETYLAKDNETGKEVVIKMVKKWINKNKLESDRAKILNSLEKIKHTLEPDVFDYQKRVVNELYNAWSKEISMLNEAEAAKILRENGCNFNTVKPINVKNNIYVMEKASGIQMDKFIKYLDENNIKLTQEEANNLINKYIQVIFEQLIALPPKGNKILHADPHAGNIFIDIKNKAKPFTFIDTGNVMKFTPKEAMQNVMTHLDYFIGNSDALAQKLLRGALLPEGMTQKEATEKLAKHLKDTFFSGRYSIYNPFTTINDEACRYMKEHNVIISTENSNLLKAEVAYLANIMSLGGIESHIGKFEMTEKQKVKMSLLMLKQIADSILNGTIHNKKVTFEELYSRYKHIKNNPETIFTTLYTYIPPESFKKASNLQQRA